MELAGHSIISCVTDACCGTCQVVTRCVVSTTMGGGFGGVTAVLVYLVYSKLTTGHAVWDLVSAGNGALTGAVL